MLHSVQDILLFQLSQHLLLFESRGGVEGSATGSSEHRETSTRRRTATHALPPAPTPPQPHLIARDVTNHNFLLRFVALDVAQS